MSRILSQATRLAKRHISRPFSTSQIRPAFATGPSPPRLPPKEQEEFERLQKASTGAFSTPQVNQSPAAEVEVKKAEPAAPKIDASGKGEELHPDMRRGAKPEFEGEVNPKTGEVGGPKNEPLRWGGSGDWSYNGRVTDF